MVNHCTYHAGLDDTSLNTSDGHRANTTDLVDILKGKTKGLISGTCWRIDGIDGLKESLASGFGLGFLLPTLVPRAVGRLINHIVTVETRDGNERNGFWVVSNLLDEVGSFLDDLLVTVTGPLGGVHFVNGNNKLPDTQGKGKQSMLTGLTILGDTSFEFTSTGSDNKNGTIGLRGTSNHVLDKITMARSVCIKLSAQMLLLLGTVMLLTDDGDVVLGCFEFP